VTLLCPAITAQLNYRGGRFTVQRFVPPDERYAKTTMQTYVMAACAEQGLTALDPAQRLFQSDIVLNNAAFIRRWLPARGIEIRRQTNVPVLVGTGQKARTIVTRYLGLADAPNWRRGFWFCSGDDASVDAGPLPDTALAVTETRNFAGVKLAISLVCFRTTSKLTRKIEKSPR
jgi:hypothetical protein